MYVRSLLTLTFEYYLMLDICGSIVDAMSINTRWWRVPLVISKMPRYINM